MQAHFAQAMTARAVCLPPRIGGIKRIRHFDVAEAVAAIEADPSLWTDNTFRQTAGRTAHRDTEAIYLHAPEHIGGTALVDIVPTVDHRGMALPALRRLVNQVNAGGYRLARAMVINLKPGGRIVEHTDGGDFADATERFHVVLKTNPWAWLSVEGERTHLRAGHLYWFDKHRSHEGANEGPTPRWHLIVDVFRPQQIGGHA